MSEMLQLNDEPHLVAEADQTLGPFPFLRLPAEIRNQIYRLCLCFPAGELARLRRLTTRNHLSAYLLPPLGLVPGLLATCRQLRTEARPLLYQANTFCAHPRLLTSMPFLVDRSRPVLQATAAAHISHWYLGIRLDCEAGFGKEEAAKAFTGADTLEIECWQTMFAMADLSVLKLFDGIRGVKVARVTGSVGPKFRRYLEGCITSPVGLEVAEWEGDTAELEYDIWTHGSR